MLEYRVRPVSRFIVTEYAASSNGASSSLIGEFQNHRSALNVAHAMADQFEGKFLPENHLNSPSALLRQIAEEVDQMIPTKRGIVFIELENGGMRAFGLGSEMGDIGELIDKGIAELHACAELVPASEG